MPTVANIYPAQHSRKTSRIDYALNRQSAADSVMDESELKKQTLKTVRRRGIKVSRSGALIKR
jgi:hypothetical protein